MVKSLFFNCVTGLEVTICWVIVKIESFVGILLSWSLVCSKASNTYQLVLTKESFDFETESHVAGLSPKGWSSYLCLSRVGITSVCIVPSSPGILVCMCLCAHACMWRPDLRLFLRSCAPLHLGIHVLAGRARLAGQWAWMICLLLPPASHSGN